MKFVKILALFTLLICLSTSIKKVKTGTEYSVTSPLLDSSISSKIVITLDKQRIAFKGCNFNSGAYSSKNG